jgi:hypothetical protein
MVREDINGSTVPPSDDREHIKWFVYLPVHEQLRRHVLVGERVLSAGELLNRVGRRLGELSRPLTDPGVGVEVIHAAAAAATGVGAVVEVVHPSFCGCLTSLGWQDVHVVHVTGVAAIKQGCRTEQANEILGCNGDNKESRCGLASSLCYGLISSLCLCLRLLLGDERRRAKIEAMPTSTQRFTVWNNFSTTVYNSNFACPSASTYFS